MNAWEQCDDRGSFNLSVQLLLFPFANDLLTYGMRNAVKNYQLHSVTSSTLQDSCDIFPRESGTSTYRHLDHISEDNVFSSVTHHEMTHINVGLY